MNPQEVDVSTLIALLMTAGTLIWRISATKEQIFSEIRKNNSSLKNEIIAVRNEVEKQSIQNVNDHEKLEYIDHSLKESLQHKTSRLEDWINQICDHLEDKDDFAINRSILRRRKDS